MPSPNTVNRARRQAGRSVATWGLLALGLAASAAPCRAADSIAGLGAAFRPPQATNATANAATNDAPARSGDSAGLRVVVSGRGRSLASIDGRIVHVGDTVNGMRVTRIGEQEVVLKSEGGEEQRLPIHRAAVKQMQPVNASNLSASPLSSGVGQ